MTATGRRKARGRATAIVVVMVAGALATAAPAVAQLGDLGILAFGDSEVSRFLDDIQGDIRDERERILDIDRDVADLEDFERDLRDDLRRTASEPTRDRIRDRIADVNDAIRILEDRRDARENRLDALEDRRDDVLDAFGLDLGRSADVDLRDFGSLDRVTDVASEATRDIRDIDQDIADLERREDELRRDLRLVENERTRDRIRDRIDDIDRAIDILEDRRDRVEDRRDAALDVVDDLFGGGVSRTLRDFDRIDLGGAGLFGDRIDLEDRLLLELAFG
ncbi:MAG TPA: hypothetical protein VM889_03470 [Candidatus Thermoplasmatota archaeon]|nr:hypothetical protein [Candidatus Thermoplasmatota archaeon]